MPEDKERQKDLKAFTGNLHLFLGSIVYNRAIGYKGRNFLKVVVHVIIIDQYNQSAR